MRDYLNYKRMWEELYEIVSKEIATRASSVDVKYGGYLDFRDIMETLEDQLNERGE